MRFAVIGALVLAACSGVEEDDQSGNGVLAAGPATESAEVAAEALPAELRSVIEGAVPGMIVNEAERKAREGRVYYDVEGRRADGSEVELDVIQEGDTFRLVEIQRDIEWAAAPVEVIAAARAAPGAFEPERVIESRQADGSVIYELFAPGRAHEPAMEVRVQGGTAEVLDERWVH